MPMACLWWKVTSSVFGFEGTADGVPEMIFMKDYCTVEFVDMCDSPFYIRNGKIFNLIDNLGVNFEFWL